MARNRNTGNRKKQQRRRNKNRSAGKAKAHARVLAHDASVEAGFKNLGAALSGQGISAGQRALHMLAFSGQYLPGAAHRMGPRATTAGKFLAEALGWGFSPGDGPAGKNMARYMGESQGFLGSKAFAKHGFEAFKWGRGGLSGVGFGGASLAYSAYLMHEGYQNDGVTGAAMGLGQSVAEGYVARSLLPKAFSSTLAMGSRGFMAGRFIAGGMIGVVEGTASAGLLGGTGILAAGGIGAGIGAIAGTLMNPLAWAVAGGIYAAQEISEAIDRKSTAGIRQKQVRALELGTPMNDQFGTIATLRQRSLSAIQNSHVNGRMALGNEAALLHTSF